MQKVALTGLGTEFGLVSDLEIGLVSDLESQKSNLGVSYSKRFHFQGWISASRNWLATRHRNAHCRPAGRGKFSAIVKMWSNLGKQYLPVIVKTY